MAIQLDFGGFDPSFIGITLRFNNRSWQLFEAVSRSPEPVPVYHLRADEKFESLSALSVLSHEVRHFHDFLLTSYSAHLFRLRILALLNLLEALPFVVTGDGNCVPVPISAWCRMSEEGRQRAFSWLAPRPDSEPWVPVYLPHVDDSQPSPPLSSHMPMPRTPEILEAVIRAATYHRGRIYQFTWNPRTVRGTTSIQPWQIFELSGLLVQIQDLWHTYGPDETDFFLEHLQSVGNNPYAMVLHLGRYVWTKLGLPFDTALTSAMVSWSLLGSYERDQWRACPTERFMLLCDHFLKEGAPGGDIDLGDLFNAWSRKLHLSSVEEGLADSRKTFHRVRELIDTKVLKGAAAGTFSADHGELLMRVADGVARANEHMIEQFLENPYAYVLPNQYIKHANAFVSPALRCVAEGGGFLLSVKKKEELEKRGYIISWATQCDEGELVVSLIKPYHLSRFVFLEPHDVLEVSDLIGLTDFLFADVERARGDVQRARGILFQSSNKAPVEILL